MRNFIFKTIYIIMDALGFVHHSPGGITTQKFPNGYHGEINDAWLRGQEVQA